MEEIKIGSRVRVNRRFKVEAIHDDGAMTISLRGKEHGADIVDYILVPLYLNGLGFLLPEFDFTLPGSYLDANHPDYYQEGEDHTVLYKGKKYKLSLDVDFNLTGKYYLLPLDGGNTITTYSKVRTDKERQNRIEETVNESFEGDILEWVLLDVILRDKDTDEYIGRKSEVGERSRVKYIGIVKDPITKLEFEFPMNYLKLKP
jgi:hypothetical protein